MRLLVFLATAALGADKVPASRLIEMAANPDASFRDVLIATLGEGPLKKGNARVSQGPDFLFAVETEQTPSLSIDDAAPLPMRRIAGSNIWYLTANLKVGWPHACQYMAQGRALLNRFDVSAYLPESYDQPGVPRGRLSEQFVHTSKIYNGMQSNYWVYVPAQYDPSVPAALMVWQDGEGHINREGASRTQIVTDNLIHQKKIPVMIHVLIQPGTSAGRAMRSIEYDTVNDTYARFLRDEVLPEVYQKWNIRRDGYSRAIAGQSSGGICAFNVAWQQPDQFSRVLSRIGSYTSIQWRPGELEGGNVYPFKVRKEPKRNIRVWLSDGSEDLENNHGSWPLQNIQVANSLKMRGYDYHFRFGNSMHNSAQGNADFPEALAWLWRDYNPSKTEQTYEQDPAEKDKPMYRVRIYNREAH
jgi:enterochelin esterase family protein